METVDIICPSCFQIFAVALPPIEEQPCEVDYECEVCCHPMLILFAENGGFAKGIQE